MPEWYGQALLLYCALIVVGTVALGFIAAFAEGNDSCIPVLGFTALCF